MIDPTRKTIADILKLQQRLKVPSYQRNFKWGTDEARDLVTDLKANADASRPLDLFLGNIIVSREENVAELSIVDGQQRLTTISILLLACRTLARRLNSPHQEASIHRMLCFVKDSSGMSYGSRIIVSSAIQTLFDYITSTGWDGNFPEKIGTSGVKLQVNRIKPIYDYFLSEIQDYDQNKLEKFLDAVFQAYVVYIEINKPEEAFEIFERTNARGIELDAADLLKNFLFQQQHGHDLSQELEESWADIVDNADGTILRMLKYFWVTHSGYVQKKSLYPNLRDYGRKIGAKSLVTEILKFSLYYSAVRSGEAESIRSVIRDWGFTLINGTQEYVDLIKDVFQALSLFKVTQATPLIYAAFKSYELSSGQEDKTKTLKLLSLLKTIEKYHFINNVICERVGNEVERLYADFAPVFYKSTKFEKSVDDMVISLKQKLAGPDEFIPRFADLRYSTADIPLICYTFDRINNNGLRAGQSVSLFNPDRDYIKRNFDIEHFFPQKPSASDKLPNIGDTVHSIGNLLVISKYTNRNELKNLSPKDKAIKLKNSLDQIQNLTHIREFLETYHPEDGKWGEGTINKRSLELAKEAYNKVWSF